METAEEATVYAAENYLVTKRDGRKEKFDQARIRRALEKAWEAYSETPHEPEKVTDIPMVLDGILREITEKFRDSQNPDVEAIQDIVEKHLVQEGSYRLAKLYILYREKRKGLRNQKKEYGGFYKNIRVKGKTGETEDFDLERIIRNLERHTRDLPYIQINNILRELARNLYTNIPYDKIEEVVVLSVIPFIEEDTEYDRLASRFLRQKLYRDVLNRTTRNEDFDSAYREVFQNNIREGVEAGLFDPRLAEFDFSVLEKALRPERDDLLRYLGLETLRERYFAHRETRNLETPQAFWMRVAMGLSILEKNKEEKAVEFYEVLSGLRFVASTPTLFHSGSVRSQLSSCYLNMVEDDLKHIFKSISDNAQMAKWSGGTGTDWTNIRATGARIKSTNVESQGVIPFLKVANDTTVAINRSGKRRGAAAVYLETWHLDIEDFVDLRRNTGDERRRTHDISTANWVPDLFMKRVEADGDWTLFSPDEVPDLHEIYGKKFEERYTHYESLAAAGKMRKFKVIKALKLWRKMLTRLFETGHPWITFKDPCNVRSPQDHAGVIHNSNLCTEITLNNSSEETAVCNLGSLNLEKHVDEEGTVRWDLLKDSIRTAVRMLDNVIDINFYPTEESRRSNLKHRPIGLGLMGVQDLFFKMRVSFQSRKSEDVSDRIMEFISLHAIEASALLAEERGAYESFKGSKWDRNIFPQDTLSILFRERGEARDLELSSERLDWSRVRESVRRHGLRNSNIMSIAPTATISNIAGCYPCIEPVYKNLYVKSNMSGEFTVINRYLVEDLKRRGLWTGEMREQLKYYDGNIDRIQGIPDELKELYKEVFEIDPIHLLRLTAIRGKWIDQSQSHNVFIQGASGKKLHEVYTAAWKLGLKTTYYLRSLGASQIEKSTLDAGKYGFTQKRVYDNTPASEVKNFCSLDDPECESCQ